jgi:uroporphyrinogen-III decarboxylase
MNGRERLLKALKHEPTDRVPLAPFTYYNAIYEMFGYEPKIATFFNPPDFDPIEKFVEYCDNFGFDVLHVLGSVWDIWVGNTLMDQTIAQSAENWDVAIEDQYKGDDELLRTVRINTPAGDLCHVEEHKRTSKYLIVSATTKYLIKNRQDFEILQRYAPPADCMDCQLISRARKATGDKGLVTANTHGSFNILGMFRRLEDILVDPIVDEGFYRDMVEYFLPRLVQRAKKMIEAGADVIEVAGHWTGQVGPKTFQKYIFENENRLVKAIHAMGALVIYHNCGDAAKIMRFYNDLEIDCWGYLTPPPYADVILEEALAVLRPTLTLRGNIDQIDFLMKATPDQVKEKVRHVLTTVKPRGNWILSTTDFFFDGTPYENIQALADAGREYGWYA